jgi:hypothetical protein
MNAHSLTIRRVPDRLYEAREPYIPYTGNTYAGYGNFGRRD